MEKVFIKNKQESKNILNSKLWNLFIKLNFIEQQHFSKFIQSPYFNEQAIICVLFEELSKIRAQTNLILSKDQLFKKIYPDKPYQDAKLRHIMNEALQLLEEFLFMERIKKNRPLRQVELLSIYDQRNLPKHFENQYLRSEKSIKNQKNKDANHLLWAYKMEAVRYRNHLSQRGRSQSDSLPKAMIYLDEFYFAEKLRMACAMYNNTTIVEAESTMEFMEEILSYIKNNPKKHSSVFNIYYGILNSILEGDHEAHFEEVWKIIAQETSRFSKEEANEMYIYLLNFAIRRINQKGDYLQKCFDIYQEMISKKIIFQKGWLTPWTFKNIVVVALRLGELDWTYQFIENYKKRIAPEFRENAYIYNSAKYNFYKKDFDQVLDLLQQVEYEDIFYNLDSKALLLKSYFELGEYEAMYSLMHSFRIFLRRKKGISTKHRLNFSNLIRFTRKASKLKLKDRKKAAELLQDIEKTGDVADINWLKEKVAFFV